METKDLVPRLFFVVGEEGKIPNPKPIPSDFCSVVERGRGKGSSPKLLRIEGGFDKEER